MMSAQEPDDGQFDPIAALRRPGAQARLIRIIEDITGERIPRSTAHRWAGRGRAPSAPTYALLSIIENPGLLRRALRNNPPEETKP